jgi:hypothetical protein
MESRAADAPPPQRYISPPPARFGPANGRSPSLPRPQPMVWPGDEAASLVDNHHPCAGIPAPDPGWPTTPPGSPSDGSRGDPAPGAKCGKRRIDRTHCSRRGRPTLTCRRRPRLAATRTNHHTRSPRRQRPATL